MESRVTTAAKLLLLPLAIPVLLMAVLLQLLLLLPLQVQLLVQILLVPLPQLLLVLLVLLLLLSHGGPKIQNLFQVRLMSQCMSSSKTALYVNGNLPLCA